MILKKPSLLFLPLFILVAGLFLAFRMLDRNQNAQTSIAGRPLIGAVKRAVSIHPASASKYGTVPSHLNGFVVTTHWTQDRLAVLHDIGFHGNLVRYDIHDGKVTGTQTIYAGGDAGFACISPDGSRVAFLKTNGVLAVIRTDGSGEVDPGPPGCKPFYIQWPRGDGGEWIYYVGFLADAKVLRRVNVRTNEVQQVRRFNQIIGQFGLSSDTRSGAGEAVFRTEMDAVVYNMSETSGNLYDHVRVKACGVSISPDGHYFTANTENHDQLRIIATDGTIARVFGVNSWQPGQNDGSNKWQHHRWAVNSPEWIAIAQSKASEGREDRVLYTNAVLYNWIKGEQIQVTDNAPGEFDRPQGFWVAGARTAGFALGQFVGKAPYTVQFAGHEFAGEWQYGDGDSGSSRTHTYLHPGVYEVKAVSGSQTLYGQVTVLQPHPPRILSVAALDSRHLAVNFDEPVQLIQPRLQMTPNNRAASWSMQPGNRSLVVETVAPLQAGSRLQLSGIYDRSQNPDPMAPQVLNAPVLPQVVLSGAGRVFDWQTAVAANQFFNPFTRSLETTSVKPRGAASFNREGQMVLDGGSFQAPDLAPSWDLPCLEHQKLTLEASIQPAGLNQGSAEAPARIIDSSLNLRESNFWLGQDQDTLWLGVQVKNQIGDSVATRTPLCRLTSAAPFHLVVSVGSEISCWVNGRLCGHQPAAGVIGTWKIAPLNFGSAGDEAAPWKGALDGVRIYSGILTPAQVGRGFAAFQAQLQQREKNQSAIAHLEINARLLAASPTPTLTQIAPYRDALIVCEYQVEQVISGSYRPTKIRVSHWALRNGQPTAYASLLHGHSYRMVLEPLKNHPELQDKYTSDTLEDNFDLEPFTDASSEG